MISNLAWAARKRTTEWHTNFRLYGGGGLVVLSRRVDGTPKIVDYVNYADLADNLDARPQRFYRVVVEP